MKRHSSYLSHPQILHPVTHQGYKPPCKPSKSPSDGIPTYHSILGGRQAQSCRTIQGQATKANESRRGNRPSARAALFKRTRSLASIRPPSGCGLGACFPMRLQRQPYRELDPVRAAPESR